MAPWHSLLPWLLAAGKLLHRHHAAPHRTSPFNCLSPVPLPAAARRLLLSGTPLQNGKDPSSALQAAVYQHPPDGASDWIAAEMYPTACWLCRPCAARTPLRIPASPRSDSLPSSSLLLPTDLQEPRTLLLPRSVLACCSSLHLPLVPAPLPACRPAGAVVPAQPAAARGLRRQEDVCRVVWGGHCVHAGGGMPRAAAGLAGGVDARWGTLPGACKPLLSSGARCSAVLAGRPDVDWLEMEKRAAAFLLYIFSSGWPMDALPMFIVCRRAPMWTGWRWRSGWWSSTGCTRSWSHLCCADRWVDALCACCVHAARSAAQMSSSLILS